LLLPSIACFLQRLLARFAELLLADGKLLIFKRARLLLLPRRWRQLMCCSSCRYALTKLAEHTVDGGQKRASAPRRRSSRPANSVRPVLPPAWAASRVRRSSSREALQLFEACFGSLMLRLHALRRLRASAQ